MARTISFVKGRGTINHNNRTFIAENVDANRTPMNITYVKKPIEQAYEEIFGEAVASQSITRSRKEMIGRSGTICPMLSSLRTTRRSSTRQ